MKSLLFLPFVAISVFPIFWAGHIFAAPGDISTVGGSGLPGYTNDGGQATEARISATYGVATDYDGNIFFADTENNCIRRINITTGLISTVAGDGSNSFGGDGDLAIDAQLDGPTDVALDTSGNLYIADRNNHRIRMVDITTGNISTIAGSGATGAGMGSFSGDGGAATSATLDSPTSVDISIDGNIYISDTNNHRIREIDAMSGNIDTFAGSGATGVGNGGFSGEGTSASTAQLNEPAGISLHDTGLFIADRLNNRIRFVSFISDNIETVVGDGSNSDLGENVAGSAATVYNPIDVAADTRLNVYFTSPLIGTIRRLTQEAGSAQTGLVNTVAGTGTSGYNGDNIATESQLNGPRGLAVDRLGNLAIADSGNYRIRKVEKATDYKIVTTVAGTTQGFSGDTGDATAAQLDDPHGLSINRDGDIFFSDRGNLVIRMVDGNTGIIDTAAGDPMATPGSGNGGLAIDAGFFSVSDVALDPSGNLYLADRQNSRVRKIDASTDIITLFAGDGSSGTPDEGVPATSSSLKFPSGLFLDSKGYLLITCSDTTNSRVREVNLKSGIIHTIAGTDTPGYNGDDIPASTAFLNTPWSVVRDLQGNIYIADTGNHRIRKVDAKTGLISTIAGTGVAGYSGDVGAANLAQLDTPKGLEIDAAGDLYIADSGNHAIRKIDMTDGLIYTIAGDGMDELKGDGGDSRSARFDNPTTLAFDTLGNLFVADSGNHRIRMIEEIGLPATYQTDGKIGPKLTRLLGNNVYNTSASGQTAKIRGTSNRPQKFFFTVENDSNVRTHFGADSFQVSAKKGNRFLQTKYIQIGGGNVTGAITRGNLILPNLGPGNSTSFKTVVKPKFDRGGKGRAFLITAKSLLDPTKRDALKAKVKVKIKAN